MLGAGNVQLPISARGVDKGMAEFRIRDTKLLLKHIIPIFDQNPLLTSKYYNYHLFKQAILIATNNSLTTLQRHSQLTKLKNQVRPVGYISPA